MNNALKVLFISMPLAACGGGDGVDKTTETKTTDYSHISEAALTPEHLREASASELSQLMKNGVRLQLRQQQDFNEAVRDVAISTNDAKADSTGSSHFSNTNIQVAGVDEADFVKYDGKHIFLAAPLDYTSGVPQQFLKILATDATSASTTPVADIALDNSQWGSVSELYLVNDQTATTGLVSIRRSWNFYAFHGMVEDVSAVPMSELMDTPNADDPINTSEKMSILPYQMNNGVEVTLYDVRSITNPNKTWSITLDGDLIESRKIGNKLYLITSFMPGITHLDYQAITPDSKIANEAQINNTALETLLPEYSINNGTPQVLTTGENCLVPNSTDDTMGFSNLIHITAIDLESQQLIESLCINSNITGIYSSPNNIYLGGSPSNHWEDWSSYTVIHQFALTEHGVDYKATGAVEGILGWDKPAFRMDEYKQDLRVVTTTFNENFERTHHLHVLRNLHDDNTLTEIATLPNEVHPEPIGKPREDIYSVRFYGEKAYIVTFERKDPLYVVNLTDAENPFIAGDLEIPGFSTYLHPVGDNYIFSFGNETDENGVQSGLKVSLFDVRDMENPTLINHYVLGNGISWSDALYDSHALTFLQSSTDQLRVSLPMTLYTSSNDQNNWSYEWINTSLQLFEINGLDDTKATLSHVGEVISESSDDREYPMWYGNDRGLLHDNSIFYIHGNRIIGDVWPSKK